MKAQCRYGGLEGAPNNSLGRERTEKTQNLETGWGSQVKSVLQHIWHWNCPYIPGIVQAAHHNHQLWRGSLWTNSAPLVSPNIVPRHLAYQLDFEVSQSVFYLHAEISVSPRTLEVPQGLHYEWFPLSFLNSFHLHCSGWSWRKGGSVTSWLCGQWTTLERLQDSVSEGMCAAAVVQFPNFPRK